MIKGITSNFKGDLEVHVVYGGEGLCKTKVPNVNGSDMQAVLGEVFEAIQRSIDQLSQGTKPDNAIGLQSKEYKEAFDEDN